MKKTKGLIDLIRPFTLLAPIIVSISIMLASLVYNYGDFSTVFLMVMLPAVFSLALLNAASNALNQVTDVEADRISKPYRPIPRGCISPKEALFVSVILYIFSFISSLLVNPVFSVFVLLIAFFTITYSIPPRLKDRLFLNQLWVGVPRGLLGILASWSVFGNPLSSLPLIMGFIAMLFLIGGCVTKDVVDCDADKKTGTLTLINTYGVNKTVLMIFPFMFFPFLFIPILVDIGLINSNLVLLTLLAFPSFFICYFMVRDDKKSKKLENTFSWVLMYTTYFFFALGFSALTIINYFFV